MRKEEKKMAKVRVFTDGACSGNPGPGGYAAILFEESGYKVVSGYSIDTTNNRMELMAVIEGIKKALSLGYQEVEVYADSAYVVNAVVKNWLSDWKRKGWLTAKGTEVKNKKQWIELDRILANKENAGKVKLIKVKGHDGNQFNELADKEAVRQSNIAKEALKEANCDRDCPCSYGICDECKRMGDNG